MVGVTGNQPGLFTPGRRRRGRTEAAMDRQLAAWAHAGHLTGDEHAAHRRILRGLAETVDAADRDYGSGDVTALQRARVHGMLLEAVQQLLPDQPATDALDDALVQLLQQADAP